jgi:dimethylargininase
VAATEQIAIVRPVPDTLAGCELTHQTRTPIDVERARHQHAAYVDMLGTLGCTVVQLPRLDEHPDSVFVEDTMLVLPEVAIALRPGAPSRRGEVQSVTEQVMHHRPVHPIESPATVDGGDLLVVGRNIHIGLSSRSSADALDQLQRLLDPWGYTLHGIPVDRCLHLKSAATSIGDDTVLCNPEWVDPTLLHAKTVIECDPREPDAANALFVAGRLVTGRFPETNRRLQDAGHAVHALDLTELAKAEGAVTCCSILLDA